MSSDRELLGIFWQFTLLSLLAVGGLQSVIPDMQRYMVEQTGWLTARQFGEVYALSQATPGPNVMVVTMLGAVVAGPFDVPEEHLTRMIQRVMDASREAATIVH